MKMLMATVVYLVIGVLEAGPLLRRGQIREVVVVAVIIGLGVIYAAGLIYRWPVPNPVQAVDFFFGPVARLLGAP